MISVTILVKNGERRLREVLAKLTVFDEVLLIDTGSDDATLDIVKNFPNISLYHREFKGFGPLRNVAASLAKHDWVLALDADEVLSEKLIDELLNLPLDSQTIYRIPRINIFNEKKIKGCGWHPEFVTRLYDKTKTKFSEALVHESLISDGFHIETLKNSLLHYSYETISDFLKKMEHYSSLFAEQYRGKKTSSPLKAFFHGIAAFLKGYFLKRGILDGYEGFLISSYNAQTTFYKYLKLYHFNKR